MARVDLPTPESAAAEDQWIFDRIRAERPSPRIANIFRLMANVPAVLDKWLPLGTEIRKAPGLDAKDTALVILATADARGSAYEYNQNWNAGQRAGLTAAQVEGVAHPDTAADYSDEQRDLIRFARSVAGTGAVDDALWSRVHGRMGDERTVALLFLIGWFTMNSCLTGPTQLEMEADFKRL